MLLLLHRACFLELRAIARACAFLTPLNIPFSLPSPIVPCSKQLSIPLYSIGVLFILTPLLFTTIIYSNSNPWGSIISIQPSPANYINSAQPSPVQPSPAQSSPVQPLISIQPSPAQSSPVQPSQLARRWRRATPEDPRTPGRGGGAIIVSIT